jgi:GAF domain-containing protein
MNLPNTPLPEPQGERSIDIGWQERVQKILLRSSLLLASILLILYLLSPAAAALKLAALMLYGLLVGVILASRLPYPIRAAVFLIVLYTGAIHSFLEYGLAEGSILLLAFVAGATLHFSAGVASYLAVGIMLVTILVIGDQTMSVIELVEISSILLAVAVTIVLSLRSLLQDFLKVQERVQQMQEELQKERSLLERRIEERTASFTLKTEQFRTASFIARKTAEAQDLASLLTTAVRLISEQFGFYHTAIFMVNEPGDLAVLQAASSVGGQRMIENGYSVALSAADIIGMVVSQKKSRIRLDMGEDAVLFNNPDLPLTRSQVCLPFMVRNKVLGVLDIQANLPQAFSSDDIDVLQTLADQIAIAIENTRLLEETQAAVLQLEALSSIRTRKVWSQELRRKSRAFTYTPLGLRAEKVAHDNEKAVNVPVTLRGQKIGSISISRKNNRAWSKLDRDILDEVASQVGLAVDNIRLLEEATQRARQEEIVGKLANRFSQSLDLNTLLQTAARELGQLPDVSEVSVFIGRDVAPAPPLQPDPVRKTSLYERE